MATCKGRLRYAAAHRGRPQPDASMASQKPLSLIDNTGDHDWYAAHIVATWQKPLVLISEDYNGCTQAMDAIVERCAGSRRATSSATRRQSACGILFWLFHSP